MSQQDLIIGGADAGAGDSFFDAFTKVQANFTELYSGKMENVVAVNAESDFPTAVSGVITLAAKTIYVLGADVATSNRFQVESGASLFSFGPKGSSLTYTGSGVMFTGVDVNFDVLNTQLVSSTASEFFSFSATVAGIYAFSLRNSGVAGAVKFGTFNNYASLITHFVDGTTLADGITLAGSNGFVSLSETAIASGATGTCLDLGSSTATIVFELKDVAFIGTASGAKGISGLVSNGNIPSGLIGQVTGCEFSGFLATSGQLTNISTSDTRWNFVNNANLENSTKTADTYLSSSRTVPITVTSQFESVNGANWTSDISERFTVSTSGVITFTGEIDEKFMVVGTATVEKSGGGADEIEMEIAINGTEASKTGSLTQNSTPTGLTCVGIFNLSENDTIELKVANNTGVADIIVSRANLNIINGF